MQTRARRIGVAAFLLALGLGALPMPWAAADPHRFETIGPDSADLRFYLVCARLSDERLLSFGEAATCSQVFMRIKLSFLPGVTLEEFQHMPPKTKSAANIEGYLKYRAWLLQNQDRIGRLEDALVINPAIVSN